MDVDFDAVDVGDFSCLVVSRQWMDVDIGNKSCEVMVNYCRSLKMLKNSGCDLQGNLPWNYDGLLTTFAGLDISKKKTKKIWQVICLWTCLPFRSLYASGLLIQVFGFNRHPSGT